VIGHGLVSVPGYAIDDETAIKVVGDAVQVDSEGDSRLFSSNSKAMWQLCHEPLQRRGIALSTAWHMPDPILSCVGCRF
jgi:hypothetical protein